MRDDFTLVVKDALAKRVQYMCSNPGCRCPTVAARSGDPLAVVNVGVASHITAAAPGGPRYDASLPASDRRAATNGIWLCQTCSKVIDSDVAAHPVDRLREWKSTAEREAATRLGKPPSAVAAVLAESDQRIERLLAVKFADLQASLAGPPNSTDAELDEFNQLLDAGTTSRPNRTSRTSSEKTRGGSPPADVEGGLSACSVSLRRRGVRDGRPAVR